MSNISPLVDSLIEAFQCLPGVGPKSAQRMVLHLLERNRNGGQSLALILGQALSLLINVQIVEYSQNPQLVRFVLMKKEIINKYV